jgi:hypothetical protein
MARSELLAELKRIRAMTFEAQQELDERFKTMEKVRDGLRNSYLQLGALIQSIEAEGITQED